MKTSTWHVVIGMVMVLNASSLVRADERGGDCRVNKLQGRYIFSARGFTIVPGIAQPNATVPSVAQPKAIVEVIDFNGDGTLSVPEATRSINGVIARSLPGTGTYTVEDNCTGTITFDGPLFDIFLSPRADAIWMIQTNPGTVFQGTATRVSRETEQ